MRLQSIKYKLPSKYYFISFEGMHKKNPKTKKIGHNIFLG